MSKLPALRSAERTKWIALVVLCLPVLIVSMDVSVLFFAVPFVAKDLHPSATQLLWIFDIYGFVLAGLLLTMGAIGDRIGRRRLLLAGATAFSVASLCAAWSSSANMLIGARALMGVGGAVLMPSTLALVRAVFEEARARAKAVAIWSAVMAAGVGIGPVLSGLLLEHFWWGSVFLINVPVMLALLALAPRLLPESRSDDHAPLDPIGSLLILAAVLPLIYGVQGLAADGSSVTRLTAVAVGLASTAMFIRRQLRREHPMLDLTLFRRRGFGGSIAVNVIAQGALVGNAILLTQYLQQVLGMEPLRAALWSLAPTVVVGGMAPLAALLAARVGRPRVMAAGMACSAVGFVELTRAAAGSGVWVCLIGATLIACGSVSVATLVTEYVVGTVPASRAGSMAGFLETTTEFAGALGIAILGSVLNAGYRHSFSAPRSLAGSGFGAATHDLAGALAAAARLPAGQAGDLIAAGRRAYVDGMHAAVCVAAAVLLVGIVVALTRLPRTAAGRASSGPGESGTSATPVAR